MQTSLIRVAAPAALPVDREIVFAHLRSITIGVDEGSEPTTVDPDDATYIDALIEMAVDRLDGPQGLLNRALIQQEWRASYDGFPAEITIPLARCSAISSITYLDRDGAEQTLDPSAYRVTGLNTDRCRVRPVNGTAWPSTYADDEAVSLTFVSGFGVAAEEVPGSIRHAILEMVSRGYEYSEPIVSGSINAVPGSAASAVTDWRVWPE